MAKVGSLTATVTAHTAPFEAGMDRAKKKVAEFTTGVEGQNTKVETAKSKISNLTRGLQGFSSAGIGGIGAVARAFGPLGAAVAGFGALMKFEQRRMEEVWRKAEEAKKNAAEFLQLMRGGLVFDFRGESARTADEIRKRMEEAEDIRRERMGRGEITVEEGNAQIDAIRLRAAEELHALESKMQEKFWKEQQEFADGAAKREEEERRKANAFWDRIGEQRRALAEENARRMEEEREKAVKPGREERFEPKNPELLIAGSAAAQAFVAGSGRLEAIERQLLRESERQTDVLEEIRDASQSEVVFNF